MNNDRTGYARWHCTPLIYWTSTFYDSVVKLCSFNASTILSPLVHLSLTCLMLLARPPLTTMADNAVPPCLRYWHNEPCSCSYCEVMLLGPHDTRTSVSITTNRRERTLLLPAIHRGLDNLGMSSFRKIRCLRARPGVNIAAGDKVRRPVVARPSKDKTSTSTPFSISNPPTTEPSKAEAGSNQIKNGEEIG